MLSLESQRVFQNLLLLMTGPLGNSDFVSLGKQDLLFPSEQKIQNNANALQMQMHLFKATNLYL